MSLLDVPILVMCDDPPSGHALVTRICQAGGDVVFAANSLEALRQLRQFQFSAAVLGWQAGTDAVAAALRVQGVPFFMYGAPPAGAAVGVPALLVVDPDLVVPTLATLLS